jgi:hypothetical protein
MLELIGVSLKLRTSSAFLEDQGFGPEGYYAAKIDQGVKRNRID